MGFFDSLETNFTASLIVCSRGLPDVCCGVGFASSGVSVCVCVSLTEPFRLWQATSVLPLARGLEVAKIQIKSHNILPELCQDGFGPASVKP